MEENNQRVNKDIYDAVFVKNLFNDMSKTYDRVNGGALVIKGTKL